MIVIGIRTGTGIDRMMAPMKSPWAQAREPSQRAQAGSGQGKTRTKHTSHTSRSASRSAGQMVVRGDAQPRRTVVELTSGRRALLRPGDATGEGGVRRKLGSAQRCVEMGLNESRL